jgi:ligand-binding sensor domain-containing protein/putative methionine-R-sulfoxide reductase with GAF domain
LVTEKIVSAAAIIYKQNMVKTISLLAVFFCMATLHAQYNIAFNHITTQNGLSDNNVANAAIDKNGYLWICTAEGLNKYDGRVMEKFYREKYPALKNNSIREVVCGEDNSIWIRSFGGFISMIDANQQWHSVNITEKNKPVTIYNIIKTKSHGVVLFNGNKQYVRNAADTNFTPWHFDDDSVFNQRLFYNSYLSPDEIIWTGTDEFFIMNYAKAKVTLRQKFPLITSAAAYNDHDIYITTAESGGLYKYNLQSKKFISLKNIKDQYGDKIFSRLQMVRKMADNRLIITSAFAGIYLYDPVTNKLTRYVHDLLNKRSISTNNYNNLICDSSGYVLVISATNGLSYFNVHYKPASWVSAVSNNAGFVFDGFVNTIIPGDNANTFWMGGYNQLFRWNKVTGKAIFFDYGKDSLGNEIRGNDEVQCLAKDAHNNIVAGTANNGIVILSNSGKILKQINTGNSGRLLPANRINNLLHAGNSIWIATSLGIAKMDPVTHALIAFNSKSSLRQLAGKDCGKLWNDNLHRLWIGTAREGAYCYSAALNGLFNIGKNGSNASMEVFAFEQDNEGKIYIGTMAGLIVLQHDKIVATYSKGNILQGDHCENILKDEKGNIWFDNHSDLLKLNPSKKTFELLDEKAGLSPAGIRARSSYRDKDGTFYFGNENGFTFFHPDNISEPPAVLRLSVNSIETDDDIIYLTGKQAVNIPSASQNIIFHISAIDLDQAKNIFYRYRLNNYDKQWLTDQNISSVRYNGLGPGRYAFEVQASGDGHHWVSSLSAVNVKVLPAFWQTWWFRFSAALLLATILFVSLKRREKIINAKADEKAKMEEIRSQALQYQLEIERVINYFASSLISTHNVDDMLWDVVKTCISQLGLQDCVIYLFNKEKTLLLQKAAYGPKNIDYTDIYNRVAIQPGQGIVGYVAVTGVAEVINNTATDERYMVDDLPRMSEITVPLIGSNGVIGVIDSEHPDVNFYNNRHLQILTAIGNMVVNKIEQLEAEADSHNKEIEMARLQRDVATLQLTATRAQMNPHFIFNALNSIQQYILQGNTEEANKYLSRFSRLQREILNHCDKPFISLRKEIEMLNIYLQLEQLRFNGNFDFEIKTQHDIDEEELKIPPMILQPFVENAIWHGLMPKQGHRHLSVTFGLEEPSDLLYCTICDNGIGRKASGVNKINSRQSINHESKGLSLVYRRLQLLQDQMGRTFSSSTTDLYDENNQANGTMVEVIMFTGY